MSIDPNEVYWCQRVWYWPYYGFCPNEHAWYEEMKRSQKWVETAGHAAILEYPNPKEAMVTRLRLVETGDGEPVDRLVQLVTINPRIDKLPIDIVMGTIIHEASHVFQHMCEELGEDRPSPEFTAYTLQSMAQQLLKGYILTRRANEFTVTPESNANDDTVDNPMLIDKGKAASDSSRTAHLDQTPPSTPVVAGPIVSHPRRRKGARPLPPQK